MRKIVQLQVSVTPWHYADGQVSVETQTVIERDGEEPQTFNTRQVMELDVMESHFDYLWRRLEHEVREALSNNLTTGGDKESLPRA